MTQAGSAFPRLSVTTLAALMAVGFSPAASSLPVPRTTGGSEEEGDDYFHTSAVSFSSKK